MKKDLSAYLFVLCVILSSFIINVFIKRDFSYFKESIITVNNPIISTREFSDFSYYIILKRLKQFFVIFLLFKTFRPQFIINILIVILGVFFGMAITNQIYLFGLKGIMVLVLCFIPHFPIYFFLVRALYNISQNKNDIKIIKWNFFCVMCFFALGVVFEIYFSRFFLYKIYQHIVM